MALGTSALESFVLAFAVLFGSSQLYSSRIAATIICILEAHWSLAIHGAEFGQTVLLAFLFDIFISSVGISYTKKK